MPSGTQKEPGDLAEHGSQTRQLKRAGGEVSQLLMAPLDIFVFDQVFTRRAAFRGSTTGAGFLQMADSNLTKC